MLSFNAINATYGDTVTSMRKCFVYSMYFSLNAYIPFCISRISLIFFGVFTSRTKSTVASLSLKYSTSEAVSDVNIYSNGICSISISRTLFFPEGIIKLLKSLLRHGPHT